MKITKIKEEWRPIIGYEGLYEVSDLGNVKSLNYKGTRQEKLLKVGKNHKGYLYIILCKKGLKQKNFKVSRLVAKAFIPNPNNLPQVNHLDGDKINNKVENLQWCTNQGNRDHAVENKLANTEKQRLAVKEANQIISTWINKELGLEFTGSSYDLVRAFPEMKLHQGNLSWVRLEKLNQHKGWKINDK
jgi:hypothetical protein